VESRPGRGSVFRVTVEAGSLENVRMLDQSRHAEALKARRREEPPMAAPRLAAPCRILLAEDAPDSQRLLSFILTKAGAAVTIAANGQAAVDRALQARDQARPFDLILMDMQMPVLDGYGAASLLRRSGYEGRIIALTAHAMAADRERCLAAGCDDFAAKPIERHKLIQLIARHLESEPAPA
jgi:CheY-like chemotaxis protein